MDFAPDWMWELRETEELSNDTKMYNFNSENSQISWYPCHFQEEEEVGRIQITGAWTGAGLPLPLSQKVSAEKN